MIAAILEYLLCRYSEAQHHKTLLEFLKSVGDTYQQQGRAKDFILDLLHLNVSKLFAEGLEVPPLQQHGNTVGTAVEFSTFLRTYIQKYSIRDAVLQDISVIWVRYLIKCRCILLIAVVSFNKICINLPVHLTGINCQ